MLRVLTLEGRGASTIRTVYATENRFEFLAPNLAWQGNKHLVMRAAVLPLATPLALNASASSMCSYHPLTNPLAR